MAVMALEDLASTLPAAAPLIGVDLGTRNIGIAVSDRSRTVATARSVLRRTRFQADARTLIDLATGIVIVLPLNMDGSEGRRAQATRAFARNLSGLTAIPLILWDERLSTAAVERMLIDNDTSRARRAELVDKLAAAWILQGVLDRLRSLPENGSRAEASPAR